MMKGKGFIMKKRLTKISCWCKKRVSFALTIVFTVICLFSCSFEASAATSVDTFAELKSACASGGTILITKGITLTETITIKSGKTVTLTCSHEAGSTAGDIARGKSFHGHMFKIEEGATLVLQCCINGNYKDGDGNIRGFFATNSTADGYYGKACIINYGTLKMNSDKSVIKNNYNAQSQNSDAWKYNGETYYRINSDGSGTGFPGSAIYNLNGTCQISNGKIYGCVSDNGPAIYIAAGYANDKTTISGGTLYNNIARRYGGAIFAGSRRPESDIAGSDNYVDRRTLNSTGSNAMLTVSGATIRNNVCRYAGGGIWIGHGGTLYMSSGTISGNIAVEEGGGGIRCNAGSEGSCGGVVCLGSPGGQTWIAGGSIHSNTATTNGGGITAPNNDDPNNKLTVSGGNIYSNTAKNNGGGIYSATKLIISGGNIYKNTATVRGGGVYLTADGFINMSNGNIYSNTAVDSGGGIYLTADGSASTVSGGSIYSNSAEYGGGICTYRLKGLTLSNVNIYNNKASATGGGVRSGGSEGGSLTINSGLIYGNTNIGVYVVDGTATINGGKFGVSAYTNYSTYTVSRNTTSQLTIGTNAVVTVNSTSYPRFISTITSSEAISANRGIVNKGTLTFTNTSENATDMYGTGTALYNEGTVNINGTFKIISSGKDGATTRQNRLGIQNTATGVININSSTAEISYCGARGILNNGTLNMKGGKIHHCAVSDTASENGGGVVHSGDSSVFNMSGGSIYNNEAYKGAGVYFSTAGKASKITGGSIYNNIGSYGSGVTTYRTNGLTISGGNIYGNTASINAGGVLTGAKLVLSGSNIYENTATKAGGGVYVSGASSSLTMSNGVIRNNKSGTHGAGLYFSADGGESTISGGKIYSNAATGSGGGLLSYCTNGLTISGGSIYSNTAKMYAGGIYASQGIIRLTAGSIYSNTATKDGDGVFIHNDVISFEMSKNAIIDSSNDVFLRNYAFITVPAIFEGNKNVRAVVSGNNLVPGRVIAKYGSSTTAAGSTVLYWDTSNPVNTQQYFTVKNKELRSGDLGVAANSAPNANGSGNINKQDIYITERYTVTFDMNPTGEASETITHTINSTDYLFNDLANKDSHVVASKYWYEALSFNTGKATNSRGIDFLGWNTTEVGSGIDYEVDKLITVPLSTNENLVLFAQWLPKKEEKLDIDYNGNGATKGNGWTVKDIEVSSSEYQLSSGVNSEGKFLFERKETDSETGAIKQFSFVGWSLDPTVKVQQYSFGQKVSVQTLRASSKTIEGRGNGVVTVYAVWDEFPTIEATDRWFSLSEIEAWPSKGEAGYDSFANQLYNSFVKGSDASGKAIDGDTAGDWTDFAAGEGIFELIDFNIEEFKSFTESGSFTLTYRAVDKVGNEVYKTITIHIVGSETQIGDVVTMFTRFISSKFYRNSDGSFVSEEYGGLNENSKWVTEGEYISLLEKVLSNKKDETTGKWIFVYETWLWTTENIEKAKEFVVENGIGNVENPNALTDFYNTFGP